MATLTLATRQSPLALWQAEHVAAQLRQLHPGLEVRLLPLTTRGDQWLDRPLAQLGGKGLFLKELEHALRDGRADLAVHSLKDVPMELEPEFRLAAILPRETPTDALVSVHYDALTALPAGARVGTSSLRRQVQLRRLRPDLELLDLRGNINTRLQKLERGDYHAIVLASAGLLRLGLTEHLRYRFDPKELLPAAGQGVLAIETRADDQRTVEYVHPLHCPTTARVVCAERAATRALGGSCQLPIAAYAVAEGDELALWVLVGDAAARHANTAHARGPLTAPELLGTRIAGMLLASGAARYLNASDGAAHRAPREPSR